MRFSFFTIPARGDVKAEQELNAFLSSHRVRDVQRRFVDAGMNSFWAISVCVVDAQARTPVVTGPSVASKERVDYRAVLSPPEFTAYAKLREVRKAIAAREGVPPYQILTNEQLAVVVQKRLRTKRDLEALPGFGPARAAKYGAELLAAVPQALSALDAAGAEASDATDHRPD